MTINPDDRRLYESCTYARTERLETLLAAEEQEAYFDYDTNTYRTDTDDDAPELEDIVADGRDMQELWETYVGGEHEVGFTPTITVFAHWLLGDREYDPSGTAKKADVTW